MRRDAYALGPYSYVNEQKVIRGYWVKNEQGAPHFVLQQKE